VHLDSLGIQGKLFSLFDDMYLETGTNGDVEEYGAYTPRNAGPGFVPGASPNKGPVVPGTEAQSFVKN